MVITPEALAQARGQLLSVSKEQALVDKFTAIRGYNIQRSTTDPRATISDDEISVLLSLSARKSPAVQVTTNVARSPFGGGTRAEMVFRTAFNSRVPPTPPYRVIRFVKAAQVNRLFNHNKEEFTVPGYVCYQTFAQKRAPAPDAQSLHASLTRSFSMSKWSFDGPAQEFEGGGMVNVDTPGTMSSDLPYGIMADFLIVLYEQNKKQILEVGRAAGWLCVWQGWPGIPPTFVRTR